MASLPSTITRKTPGLVWSDLLDTTADRSRARYSFNGFEVTFKARLPRGGNLVGGWSSGKAITVACANLFDPNSFRNCDHAQLDIPYRHSFKFAGNYPLPLGLMASASVISNAGAPTGVNQARVTQDPSLATYSNIPTDPVSGWPDSGGHRAARRTGEPVHGALESDGLQYSTNVYSGKVANCAGRGRVQRIQQQCRDRAESELRASVRTARPDPPGTSHAAHGPSRFLQTV